MSKYTEQADKFLKDHGIRFAASKIGYGPYFPDDKESRDIYRLVLRRMGKNSRMSNRAKLTNGMYAHAPFTSFRFGQSIAGTEKGEAPRAYDLLACLTKYAPGTFEDFCSDFGYSEDSRSAERIYKGCVKEWQKVQRFFTAAEISELRNIN